MTEQVLFYHPEKCSGCRRCEMACAIQNTGISDPAQANIRVLLHPRLGTPSLVTFFDCTRCLVCVKSCNLDAIQFAEEAGWRPLLQEGWKPVPVADSLREQLKSEVN